MKGGQNGRSSVQKFIVRNNSRSASKVENYFALRALAAAFAKTAFTMAVRPDTMVR